MQVKCYIMSHTDDEDNVERQPKIRMVTIPEGADVEGPDAKLLEAVFYYGQNDFAVGPELNTTYSLSVADVVELPNGKLYVVLSCGWENITSARFEEIRQLSRRDRCFI